MNKLKKQAKATHGTISNVFYMLKLMFKVSPMLVIGEILQHIFSILPGRLVSVIGLKFVIDEVANGGDSKKIIIGIVLMVGVLVLGEVSTSVFFEFFAHREREKLDLGIQSLFYKKASQLDLARYDDPGYYSDFILAIESSSDSLRYTLGMVRVIWEK